MKTNKKKSRQNLLYYKVIESIKFTDLNIIIKTTRVSWNCNYSLEKTATQAPFHTPIIYLSLSLSSSMDTEIRTEISRKRIVRCKVVMTVLTAARARTVQDGPEQCLFQPPLSSTPDWNQYLHSSPCKPWINVGSADPSNPFSIESAHTYTVRVYSIHREKDFAWIGRGGGHLPLFFPLHGSQPFFRTHSKHPCFVPRESRRPLAVCF